MRKYDFINIKCPMCGKRELVPSFIEFTACYGSQHDMESAMLPLCADCFDRIYESFMENVGAENMNVESK